MEPSCKPFDISRWLIQINSTQINRLLGVSSNNTKTSAMFRRLIYHNNLPMQNNLETRKSVGKNSGTSQNHVRELVQDRIRNHSL